LCSNGSRKGVLLPSSSQRLAGTMMNPNNNFTNQQGVCCSNKNEWVSSDQFWLFWNLTIGGLNLPSIRPRKQKDKRILWLILLPVTKLGISVSYDVASFVSQIERFGWFHVYESSFQALPSSHFRITITTATTNRLDAASFSIDDP
jgi:hypothetical protein